MKIKLIGCHSTMNEIKALKNDGLMDCEFLDFNYHALPVELHKKIQEIIDASQDYNLIVLTYGRCSNTLVDLVSPAVPMLIPTTHDCIGLLMGSNARYLELFCKNTRTYFFSQGWLDYGRTPYDEYLEYVEKYGEKKAGKIIQALYGHYNKAMLIKSVGMEMPDSYYGKLQKIADFFGWEIEEMEGDAGLLNALVRGEKLEDVVFIEPGQPVTLKHFAEGEPT